MQIKITVRYYLTPIIKKTGDSDWWGCGETGSGCVLFLLVGMQIGTATMENSMEAPQTVKDRTAVAFSTPTFGYISQENENTFFVCFWTIVHLQCCISFGYTTNGSYIYMEEKMATHSSILAWEVPWTEELGGLQSMELQKSWIWLSGEWKSWLKAPHSENEDHGIRSLHFLGNRWGNSRNSVRLYFFGFQNHCRWWLQPWNKKTLTPWKESYVQPR